MTSDHVEAGTIDEALVRTLLAEQFPGWARLPLRFFERAGNDHRIMLTNKPPGQAEFGRIVLDELLAGT